MKKGMYTQIPGMHTDFLSFRYLIGRQLVNYASTPPPGTEFDEEELEEHREGEGEEVAMETPMQETGEQ